MEALTRLSHAQDTLPSFSNYTSHYPLWPHKWGGIRRSVSKLWAFETWVESYKAALSQVSREIRRQVCRVLEDGHCSLGRQWASAFGKEVYVAGFSNTFFQPYLRDGGTRREKGGGGEAKWCGAWNSVC